MQPMQLHAASIATQNGGILLLRGHCERLTVVMQGDGVINAGTLLIEEAFYEQDKGQPPYTGTWSQIQSLNPVLVTGGQQQHIHIQGSFWAIRVRISVAVGGGGSVSVWAWGN
jgi:hypothetical protein